MEGCVGLCNGAYGWLPLGAPVGVEALDAVGLWNKFSPSKSLLGFLLSMKTWITFIYINYKIDRAHLSRFHLMTETESSHWNVVFWIKDKMMDNVISYVNIPSPQTYRTFFFSLLGFASCCMYNSNHYKYCPMQLPWYNFYSFLCSEKKEERLYKVVALDSIHSDLNL
jgi:hypothetical protein